MKATVRFTVEIECEDNTYELYKIITDYLGELPEDTKVEINPTSNILNYPPGVRSPWEPDLLKENSNAKR